MEWTLGLLFLLSALLFIFATLKSQHIGKVTSQEVNNVHIANLKEIGVLQESIRKMELDLEVVSTEAGVQLTAEERSLKREILDLYKRNYSIESIAGKTQVSESEIEQIVAPFSKAKGEGRRAANENQLAQ